MSTFDSSGQYTNQEKLSMHQSLYEMWKSGDFTPEEAAYETGFTVEYCRNKFAAWGSVGSE